VQQQFVGELGKFVFFGEKIFPDVVCQKLLKLVFKSFMELLEKK